MNGRGRIFRQWRGIRSRSPYLVGAIVAGLAAACTDGAPAVVACASAQATRTAAIFGAAASEDPDGGWSSTGTLAIGALDSGAGQVVCSGTLVGPRWVLTAAHCGSSPALWFHTGDRLRGATAREARRFVHPSRDVMLIELAPDAPFADLGVEPFAMWQDAIDASWIGRQVTLAGLGLTEEGTTGTRHLVEEPIVALEGDLITVDGQGRRGACGGDSGGPLLTHDSGGAVSIIGLLSRGSTSCVGLDRYERIDTLRDWIAGTQAAARANPCDDVTAEGRCEAGEPIWCTGAGVIRQACASGTACGWSAEANGYRCVEPSSDPCAGVGPIPECQDDVVVRCAAGRLVRQDCAPCGQRCVVGDERGGECA